MEKNQTADHIFTLKSIIDSYKGTTIAKGRYISTYTLSSKSSDRKCLVNIRDILKRYF
jgi:ferredoxin-fold anticodon binding domain-containing protein